MISHQSTTHNARGIFAGFGRVALATAALTGLLLASGCGGGKQEQTGTNDQATATADCPAILDISGWEAFRDLGDKMVAGEQATPAELEAFGNLPAITLWRESMTESSPSALKMGHWVEMAFWDEVGQGRPQKNNADRSQYGGAMRYSYDQRARIDEHLARYAAEGHPCRVYELAARWLEPEKLPSPFTIHFVASKPELRSHYGQLIADTGLLWAGGADQLDGQMVAILYRDKQALDGDNPLELEGTGAVAQALRVMMNEGVAAWIEDMPNTHFDSEHPRLGKVSFVPEEIYRIGIRAIDIFNTNLPRLFADPDAMEKNGNDLARALVGSGALTQGGYCMAAVIANRLGEDALHAARLSPPAFLEAYQQAALQNPLPLPIPGAIGHELHETMPALTDDVYRNLLALLEEHFPRS